MKLQRLVAIVVLIAGAGLLFLGAAASHSPSGLTSNVVNRHLINRTIWLFAGGIACGLFGMVILLASARDRRA